MAQLPITFIHLTDLHIAVPELADHRLRDDTTASLHHLLNEIRAISPVPSFCVVTGDLTNYGDEASFAKVKDILETANLGMPLVYCLGNHDAREGYNRVFLNKTEGLDAECYSAELLAGVHIIALDTMIPGQLGGHISEAQFAWLEAELTTHPDAPKLIAMHHPPCLDDHQPGPATEWMSMPLDQTQRLRAIFKGHNVVGVLCGHIHEDRMSNWYGIPVSVGIGNHFAVDPGFLPHGRRYISGTSFSLGTLRKSGLTISFVDQPSQRKLLHQITHEDWLARRAAMES